MAGTVLHAEGMTMKAETWLSVDYLHRLLFLGAHLLTLMDMQASTADTSLYTPLSCTHMVSHDLSFPNAHNLIHSASSATYYSVL